MNYKYLSILIFLIGCSTFESSKKSNHSLSLKPVKKDSELKTYKRCLSHSKVLKLLLKRQTSLGKYSWLNESSSKQICKKQVKKVTSLMKFHQNTVVVLYEKNKKEHLRNKKILDGIKKSIASKKRATFIFRSVNKSKKEIDAEVSNIVFKDKAALIISWGGERFLKRLSLWQKHLKIPTLIIGKSPMKSEHQYEVLPNKSNYALQLLKSLKERKIKKLAILTPAKYEKSPLLRLIKDELSRSDIEVVYDVIYNSNNYDSMNYACRKIFMIDKNLRSAEYKKIYLNEKEKANKEGFKLNTDLVFLPAKVSYDAILIPDNFKIVNHFVKLFDFYKMPRIPLVGTYEWRSRDLLSSESDYLQGAMFIDFIGDPNKIPLAIRGTRDQKIQISESLGLGTDYHLMSYYSARLALVSTIDSRSLRKNVSKVLRSVRIKDQFFQNKLAFKENAFNWPSFLFEVDQGEIILSEKEKKPRSP